VLLAAPGSFGCKRWTYTLTVEQHLPSRMAVVKNVLGSDLEVITPWEPPATLGPLSASWSAGTVSVTPWQRVAVPDGTEPAGFYWQGETIYKQRWTKTWTLETATAVPDPGPPLADPVIDASGRPLIGSGAETLQPFRVIEDTREEINWGLVAYSTNIIVDDARTVQLVQVCDTTDSDDVTKILAFLRPRAAGGSDAYEATPSKNGLEFANGLMKATAVGTAASTVGDFIPYPLDGSTSLTLPPDSKLFCNRIYGNILVTDGVSNVGNRDNKNWKDPCLPCVVNRDPGCPDAGPSLDSCPDNFRQYPAGAAAEGWAMKVGTDNYHLKLRTWVIGISELVSPCELNHTAYRGRTDAAAIDSGMDTAADERLPDPTLSDEDAAAAARPFDNAADPTNPYCERGPDACADGGRRPCRGHYAYFAQSAVALAEALKTIARNTAPGDYTTSGPTIGTVSGLSAGVGLIASSQFPGWYGHVYAYDVAKPNKCESDADCSNGAVCEPLDPASGMTDRLCGPPDTYPLLWDAGEVLLTGKDARGPNNGFARRIYTWDPSGTGPFDPIPIEVSKLSDLNALCNNCGLTAEIIDFIHGGTGDTSSSALRPWLLGAVINSTPAIVAAPDKWEAGLGHQTFEQTYGRRHTLAWLGASDGMLHAFDMRDGAEILALIPPDLLENQVRLYQQYTAEPEKRPTGQDLDTENHLYGVASSPRFADVYDSDLGDFRTVLYIGLGPGGRSLHAIDITHPSPARDVDGDGNTTGDGEQADPNYGYGATADPPPVKVLWSRTGTAVTAPAVQKIPLLATLGETWNIPALGVSSRQKDFELVAGNGYVPYAPGTENQDAYFYRLDPLTGNLKKNNTNTEAPYTLTHISSPAPFVRNQAFAPSTIWDRASESFMPDNIVDEALQPDLHGQLWIIRPANAGRWDISKLPDPENKLVGQPFYFNTPIAGYPVTTAEYNLMALISGSFYEKSSNVSGPNIGTEGNFVPRIFLVSRPMSGDTGTTSGPASIHSFPLGGLAYKDAEGNTIRTLGLRTQATAYPLIFTPTQNPTGPAVAAFLVFDPDPIEGECIGHAYVVYVYFNPSTLNAPEIEIADAGQGAASGLAVGGDVPLAAHSFAGANGRAHFVRTNLRMPIETSTPVNVQWWRELL